MSTKIKCQNCGNEIEITEALQKDLEKKILHETQAKYKNEIDSLKKQQENLIKTKELELEKAKIEISTKAREEAIQKVYKEYESKIESTKQESEQREKQYKESQNQLTETLKQLREARDAESKMRIEFEKQLLLEQDKIKFNAKKEAQDELNLKIAEKDKKLADLEKQLDETKRKLQQGSQQLQGEVLEIKIEELLKNTFPFDEIKEVPKGIKGADVIQIVKTSTGTECGTIVWESKNTKNWSPSWIQKLIEDQRALKAEIAVLVSSVLPEDINSFGYQNKIWISDMESAIGLSYALRHQLIGIKTAQEVSKGKESRKEIVYNYITSTEFKQRIETWVEYFNNRRLDVQKERIYFNKKWEKEEKEIQKVLENTVGIYGDLQGIIGQALPKIQQLELPEE